LFAADLLLPRTPIEDLTDTTTMSDVEGDGGDVPMAAAPAASSGPMDINTAIQEVLKNSLIHDGLARGLRESAKVNKLTWVNMKLCFKQDLSIFRLRGFLV
jgi:hypothetical protein